MDGSVTIRQESFLEQFYLISGRLNRKRFVKRILACLGIDLLAFILGLMCFGFSIVGMRGMNGMAFSMQQDIFPAFGGMLLFGVMLLVCDFSMIAGITLTIRRLQDLNHSPLVWMLGYIPVINLFFFLYLLFAKGTEGDNVYGPDPPRLGYGYAMEWTGTKQAASSPTSGNTEQKKDSVTVMPEEKKETEQPDR